MGSSVRPIPADPLDAAWEAAQGGTKQQGGTAAVDPLDAAWDAAQRPVSPIRLPPVVVSQSEQVQPTATTATDTGATRTWGGSEPSPHRISTRIRDVYAGIRRHGAELSDVKARATEQFPVVGGQEYGVAARGVAHGTLGLAEAVFGTGVQYLGAKVDSEALRKAGSETQRYWAERADKFQIPEHLQGAIADDPSLILNPEWLAYSVGDMVPSVAASLIPGAGAARLVNVGGQMLRWSPQLVSRLAMIGGAVAGGTVGGALEGTHTFQEVLRLTGGDEKKAARAGELMTLVSAGLNALSVGKLLKPGAWSSIKRFLATGAVEAATEYAEEPAESAIKMAIAGRDKFTLDDALEQMKQGLNVAPPAFLTGGLAGAAGARLSRPAAQPAAPAAPAAPTAQPATATDPLDQAWEAAQSVSSSSTSTEVAKEETPAATPVDGPLPPPPPPKPPADPDAAERAEPTLESVEASLAERRQELESTPVDDPEYGGIESAIRMLESARRRLLGEPEPDVRDQRPPRATAQGAPPSDVVARNTPDIRAAADEALERAPAAHRSAVTAIANQPAKTLLSADDPSITFRPEDARPTQSYFMRTSDIERDPDLMQYKGDVNEQGVTEKLKEAKRFNPQLAGVGYVWREPATGRVLAANMHHRHELAERTGYPVMEVKFIDAPTAAKARAEAAVQNIAEGQGTVIDAARFFRESGMTRAELKDKGVTLSNSMASSGMALAQLEGEAFDLVRRGVVKEDHGVLIGKMLTDPRSHLAAAKILGTESGRDLNQREAMSVLEDIKATGTESVTTDDLFGGAESAEAIIIERSRVLEFLRRNLKSDRALLNTVGKEAKASVLDQRGVAKVNLTEAQTQAEAITKLDKALTIAAHDPGSPVFALLSDAARSIKNGESTEKATRAVEAEVHAALREVVGGRQGSSGEPGTGPDRAGGVAVGGGQPGSGSAATEEATAEVGDTETGQLFERGADYDLFGEPPAPKSEPSDQGSMFGAKEGTAAARNLQQAEAAARSELEVLKRPGRLTSPAQRQKINARIAELEKLVNRDQKIGADELAARAAAGYVAHFTNEADGVTVQVHRRDDGQFAVSLRDDDAGETMPTLHIFPTEAAAIARAKEIASGKPRPGGDQGALKEDGPRYDAEKERFYSRLERAIESAPFEKGTPDQWRAQLSKNVAKGEVEWTKIDRFLNDAGPSITKAQVREQFEQNRIRLDESVGSGKDTPAIRAAAEAAEKAESFTRATARQLEDATIMAVSGRAGDKAQEREALAQIMFVGNIMHWDEFVPNIESVLNGPELHKRVRAELNKLAKALSDARAAEKAAQARHNQLTMGHSGGAKWEQYTEPGGTNYREIKIQLERPDVDGLQEELRAIDTTPLGGRTPEQRARADDLLRQISAADFESGHFDEPNILVHLRVKDRVGPNGEKVLFAEEIQSDWHEQGRERGYHDPAAQERLKKLHAEGQELARRETALNERQRKLDHDYRRLSKKEQDGLLGEEIATEITNISGELAEIRDRQEVGAKEYHAADRARNGVPDAPMKRTEEWVKLALRRLVQEAVDGGYDRIAWTTGEQQARRFDLSQHVQWINWRYQPEGPKKYHGDVRTGGPEKIAIEALPIDAADSRDGHANAIYESVKPEDLSNTIGKELARQVKEAIAAGKTDGRFEGDDLKVGGHGMVAFYEEMIPKFAKDVGKELGVNLEVEHTGVELAPADAEVWRGDTRTEAWEGGPRAPDLSDVQEFVSLTQERLEDSALGPVLGIMGSMKKGRTFDAAMAARSIPEQKRVADFLKLKLVREYKTSPQPSFKITPELKAAVEKGPIRLMERVTAYRDARPIPEPRSVSEIQMDLFGRDDANVRMDAAIPQWVRDEITKRVAAFETDIVAYEAKPLAARVYNPVGRSLAVDVVVKMLREADAASLVGVTMADMADYVAAAQVLRNPFYETFYVHLTKGGRIVGSTALSSRVAGTSIAYRGTPEYDLWDYIADRAELLGADGYGFTHNHPTGSVTPSDDDLYVTRTINAHLRDPLNARGRASLRYHGHVVINHEKYSVINETGDVITSAELPNAPSRPDPFRSGGPGTLPHPALGLLVTQTADLLVAAREVVPAKGNAHVLWSNAAGAMQEVGVLSVSWLERTPTNAVQRAIADHGATMVGAGRAFLVVWDSPMLRQTLKPLVEAGVFRDVVFTTPEGHVTQTAMGLGWIAPHTGPPWNRREVPDFGTGDANRGRIGRVAGADEVGYAPRAPRDGESNARQAAAGRQEKRTSEGARNPRQGLDGPVSESREGFAGGDNAQPAAAVQPGIRERPRLRAPNRVTEVEQSAETATPDRSPLSSPRHPQIDTPEFRRWFGDSKVVDASGEPLVVYHGTRDVFDKFNFRRTGQNTGNTYGGGRQMFFTSNPTVASGYALPAGHSLHPLDRPNVLPVYLSIQNPAVVDAGGKNWLLVGESVATAERLGHDGVIIRNVMDHGSTDTVQEGPVDVFVVFKAKQIKSATGNRGTFDPKDASIVREGQQDYRARLRLPGQAGFEQEQEAGRVAGRVAAVRADLDKRRIPHDLSADSGLTDATAWRTALAALDALATVQGQRALAAWRESTDTPTAEAFADFLRARGASIPRIEAVRTVREPTPDYDLFDDAETPPASSETTGVKNTASAADRARLGMGERVMPEPRTQDEMYEAGKALDAADPGAMGRLMMALRNDPERIVGTKEEAGLLLKHRVDLDRRLQELVAAKDEAVATDDVIGEAAVRLQLAAHRETIREFVKLAERTGTATGRALAARRMMSKLDYSLSNMEAMAEAAKGAPLTDDELTRVKALYDEMQVKLAAVQKDLGDANERAANAEADLHHAKLRAEAMAPVMGRVVKRLDAAADAARARIRARGLRASAGMDPEDLADHAILGAAELAKGAVRFGDWAARMVGLGDYVKPHLREIFDAANAQLNKELRAERETKTPPPRGKHPPVRERFKKRVDDGIDSLGDLQSYLRVLALEHIRNGVTAREKLLDALHADVKAAGLDVGRAEVRDALSGYGQFRPLDKAADKARLREIQGELQKLAQLEALQRGQAPLATGFERQPPSDEARRLTQQVNEAKKKAGITVVDVEGRLKSALAAAKTRTRNAINDLQAEIDTGTRTVAGKSVLISDPELDALRKQLADMRKIEAEVFAKPELTDEQRLALATRAAKRVADSWADRLGKARKGVFGTPSRRRISNPEIDALRAQANAAREEYNELKGLDPAQQASATARANQQYRTHLARQEAELLDRLARQDFVPRPKKIGTQLDAESIRRRTQVESVKRRWQQQLDRWERAQRSKWQKARDALAAAPGTAKSIKASLDVSALFRQGLRPLITHPRTWLHNSLQSFVDVAQTFGGHEVMDAVHADLESRANASLYRRAKLALTAHEEAFPTSLPARIPVIGRAFKASEVAFTAFQYRMRADIFDQYIDLARATGVDVNDTEQLRSIGTLVNSLTARANLGRLEVAASVVNDVFFAPRLIKAHFDVLTAHMTDPSMSSFARKQAATNLIKVVSAMAVIMAIAGALWPDSVEEDPRSADFGRIKIRDTRFDFSGGMRSMVTLAARLLTMSSKSSTTGRVTRLNSGKFGSRTGADVLYQFFENKLSPTAAVAKDLLKGETFAGKKPTIASEAVALLVPISIENAIEIFQSPDGAHPLAVILADGVGIGTQTYAATYSGLRQQARDAATYFRKADAIRDTAALQRGLNQYGAFASDYVQEVFTITDKEIAQLREDEVAIQAALERNEVTSGEAQRLLDQRREARQQVERDAMQLLRQLMGSRVGKAPSAPQLRAPRTPL